MGLHKVADCMGKSLSDKEKSGGGCVRTWERLSGSSDDDRRSSHTVDECRGSPRAKVTYYYESNKNATRSPHRTLSDCSDRRKTSQVLLGAGVKRDLFQSTCDHRDDGGGVWFTPQLTKHDEKTRGEEEQNAVGTVYHADGEGRRSKDMEAEWPLPVVTTGENLQTQTQAATTLSDDSNERRLSATNAPSESRLSSSLEEGGTDRAQHGKEMTASVENDESSSCPRPGVAADAGVKEDEREEEEPVTCRVACQSWAGQKNRVKKTNQDAYCFMRSTDRRCLLFGVFDGHGPNGQHAAKFVKENIPQCLLQQPNLFTDTPTAFMEAFAVVDKSLESHVDCSVSGTTAVIVHIQAQTLTLAWTGDSRGVIGRLRLGQNDGEIEAFPLSVDHKPDMKAEKKRILDNNGRVDRLQDQFGDEVGPYRVWLRHAPILGLAMSRSLGDNIAHTVGVSAEPEIRTHHLTQADSFLILASDGVWEFISNEEAVKIVADSLSPESGCKKLMMTARARWLAVDRGCYVDDITAMVIGFTHR